MSPGRIDLGSFFTFALSNLRVEIFYQIYLKSRGLFAIIKLADLATVKFNIQES